MRAGQRVDPQTLAAHAATLPKLRTDVLAAIAAVTSGPFALDDAEPLPALSPAAMTIHERAVAALGRARAAAVPPPAIDTAFQRRLRAALARDLVALLAARSRRVLRGARPAPIVATLNRCDSGVSVRGRAASAFSHGPRGMPAQRFGAGARWCRAFSRWPGSCRTFRPG